MLLFGSESWVINDRDQKRLDAFHNRCARFIAKRHIRQLPDGTWETPDSNETLQICGLRPISAYVAKRKADILHTYAEPHSEVYQRCLRLQPSNDRRLLWWTT